MFRYLFVDAEDGAPVEVEVTLGIAPRIKHDPDEAHYLVRHLPVRVCCSNPGQRPGKPCFPFLRLLVISCLIAVSYKNIYEVMKYTFTLRSLPLLIFPEISSRSLS